MKSEPKLVAPREVEYPDAKIRRDARRAAKVCINGGPGARSRIIHGPVVSGGKCQRCVDVHKGTA